MTRDEIMEIAKSVWSAGDSYIGPKIDSLEKFVKLILIPSSYKLGEMEREIRLLKNKNDLPDIRCGYCGYMTYHSEHRGCIRAATAREDAERYRWLRDNSARFSWNPSRYNNEIISGFSAFNTSYIGVEFEKAIDKARGQE